MNDPYYEKPKKEWWQGRVDGDAPEQMRWWQSIQLVSLESLPEDIENASVLLGFACDEGIKRNMGRTGAAEGPRMIRKACGNLPDHFPSSKKIFDAGNIICIDQNLEIAQEQLALGVSAILKHNGMPILLGGGHEILYGHYCGVRNVFPNKKTGIINFDAHFDLRPPGEKGPSSGTGFYQIAADCKDDRKEFLYLPIGIQESGNTRALFDIATQLDVSYILAQDFNLERLSEVENALCTFINKTDVICMTIDLDVFSAAIAPGVSAPAAAGLFYNLVFRDMLQMLAHSGKIISLDIAELNPKYDRDEQTAKLAAQLLFDWHQYAAGK